jgi:hypothetical protein
VSAPRNYSATTAVITRLCRCMVTLFARSVRCRQNAAKGCPLYDTHRFDLLRGRAANPAKAASALRRYQFRCSLTVSFIRLAPLLAGALHCILLRILQHSGRGESMKRSRRIGIYAGTFNPRNVRRTFSVDTREPSL